MILTLRVSEAQKSYFIYFLAVCHEKKKKNKKKKERKKRNNKIL